MAYGVSAPPGTATVRAQLPPSSLSPPEAGCLARLAVQGLGKLGARVVVAARRADALEELARECEAAGGQALAVPTDMTDEAAVAELARRAVSPG